MSVAYIQPIFVPDERLFQKNIRSIRSLKEYGNVYKIPDRLIFGGWGVDQYVFEIEEEIKKLFPESVCVKYEKNFGKAHIVNDLYNKYIKDDESIEYLLLSDSDIVYDLNIPNFVERLIVSGETLSEWQGKPFGLIAPNQAEGSCHALEKILANRYNFDTASHQESVTYPNEPSGIAGSCWLTARRAWDAVGGYRTMGVYAGEDAYYLMDLDAQGFSYSMCDSIHVIHPPDTDPDYNKWKYDTCVRDTTGHVVADLDDKIKDANDFWSSRNPNKAPS
ncbi:hypothetical protein [Azospirillum rugosum]|uniref:Uncharacterized protein n=1 Tax=Azospirillum rugosum TaxID=416170 RepID=A0ABS4SNX7_9PROT|nr:hypothetical protein [Azospirillum rugosum]MBP2294264.1 hypothetical protein [Azospirillum rugosum]MDQ0527599.1 hypothetical protein [Azospirillum rugosum]